MRVHIEREGPTSAFFAARSVVSDASHVGAQSGLLDGDDSVSPAARLERHIEVRAVHGVAESLLRTTTQVSAYSYLSTIPRNSLQARYLNLSDGKLSASTQKQQDFVLDAERASHSLSAPPPKSSSSTPWRLQCFLSRGRIGDAHLRLYFLQRVAFVDPSPSASETRIERLGDARFVANTPLDLRDLYARVVNEASTRMGPAIAVQHVIDDAAEDSATAAGASPTVSESILLLIGHRVGSTHSYFTGTSDVYRWIGLYAVAKSVEVFSNGIVVFLFRLRVRDYKQAQQLGGFTPAPTSFGASHGASGIDASLNTVNSEVELHTRERLESALVSLRRERRAAASRSGLPTGDDLRDMVRDVALHFCLPRTSLTPLLHRGLLSAQEVAWAYCAWKWAYTFLSRSNAEFASLTEIVKSSLDASVALALVSKLRKALVSSAFTEGQILETINRWPDVIS